jgi:hypothetical protein
MRKLWFLAPACVLLFSLQVLAANRADSRSPKDKDTEPKHAGETVELFDAIKSGDIEVRVIAKDATAGNVLIKNVTAKRLAIRLPEAFAAVPVAAQFGVPGGRPLGGGPFNAGGGNPFGGGFPGGGGGGVGFNNGLMGQGGANQALGGGFQGQGQNGLNGGNGFNLGNGVNAGNGRGFGLPGGGLFKVEPEKVGKLKMTSVCLEYGKPDPNAHKEYELRPLDTVVGDPVTMEAVKMLARGEIDQKGAQAAAWHLCNGLTWEELEKKIGRKHLTGRVDLFFNAEQLARGKEIAKEAHKRAEANKQQQDEKSTSLAQQ